ncbi:hypothetical protein HGP14_09500 [Rhizobium sp. P32RR-XVIII]|uniref:hypothetical protein n=1 Tax=Rhizobium sp. P32RR-XVIII TaxID=2726738 RepID=UPI001456D010|nr:hypothetical protein [Rhizobium sp. P32RR-XVIII]NLS03592.1 hypothetical protein [Rhizobium sp. P32RR-XVIII]
MTAIGDNSSKAETDHRLLVAYYHRKDLANHFEAKRIADERKANRKNANSHGISSQKLDHYLKSVVADDKQKVVDKHLSDRQNLEWMGLIAKTSGGDLLDQAERVTGETLVRAKGFQAGLLGNDRVSGYMAGSDEDHWWLTSYDEGRKEYDTKLPDLLARINEQADIEAPPEDEDDDEG